MLLSLVIRAPVNIRSKHCACQSPSPSEFLGRAFGITPLGGSWVVVSRVIIRVTTLMTHIRELIAPLKTTPEPPSRV